MGDSSLKDKTAKGLVWGAVNNGGLQLLNLVFGIFLARLLTAADYGMVGMIAIFSLVAGALQESGFIAAMANRKSVTAADYNSVFWFNIIVSLCLYGILWMCAPAIARFYDEPALTALCRYTFIGFVVSSTGIAQSAYIFRNMLVKQRTMASLTGMVVSGTVGVTMAFMGYSYWALATQSIVYIAVSTAGFWMISPWRPSLPVSFKPVMEMLPFSAKLLVTNVFGHFNNNLFAVVLGKFYGDTSVGYFNQANKWCGMGHALIAGMANQVAQPVFARVAADRERQLGVFRKMLRFMSFVSFPTLFGLALISRELITIAITDKWAPSIELLQLLCIWGSMVPLQSLFTHLLISKGRSGTYMWCTIALGLTQLASAMAMYPLGIRAMVLAYVAINLAWMLVWWWWVRREIGLRLVDALRDVLPFLVIAALVMIVTAYATMGISNLWLSMVAKVVIAAALYAGAMRLTNAQIFNESLAYLRSRLK